MMRNDRFAELFALAEAFCHDELTADQRTRLEQLVTSDEEMRRAYVRYLHMHVCLRRAFEQSDRVEMAPPGADATPLAVRRSPIQSRQETPVRPRFVLRWPMSLGGRRSVGLVAASVLALAGVALALLGPNRAPDLPRAASYVAVLTKSGGCVWETANPPRTGDRLQPGRLELLGGMAEITFASGAVALVEAPAVLDLISSSRGFLHAGRVVVNVPLQAAGFVMDTNQVSAPGQGTRFGVGIDRGQTMIEAFDGVVEYDVKADPAKGTKRLTAGEGVRIDADANVEPMEPDPTRFVLRMPPAKERGADWLVPYNKSRYDAVHLVPAPAGVNIDGDLNDWDLSGRFFIGAAEPYTKAYNVQGAMMYDDKYLYIGAHVSDPAPMCSAINPKTEPSLGWKGGGVQVRICTDRSAGYPLDAIAFPPSGQTFRPQDKSDQLAHLTMWYYGREQKPCLHIHYGMDFHGERINPPGFQAAYRQDPEGTGYTMEYAIPWALLCHGKEAPRGGDELAACWNIHWSDEEGRVWRGYLVDILNPDEKGYTYQRGQTWGRAIFHKTGDLPPGTVVPRY
jgi:hypothetical protein